MSSRLPDQSVTDQVREIVSALEEQIVAGLVDARERLLEDRLTAQFSCKKMSSARL